MTNVMHPNLAILSKMDIRNLDACVEVFADNFVWHYFNPKMPELEGDYHGISGMKEFFMKMNASNKGTLQVKPVEAYPIGDELVVTHSHNQFTSESVDNGNFEFDALVVWRIVNDKIAEAWDIPAVHTIRMIQQSSTQ